MAGKGRDLSIPWPFAPSATELNGDGNLLKLIAMLTMFADHAGKMLLPQYRIMRVIGRLAFPIYAYCIAMGCVYTRNPLNYLKRLLALALVTQPIYAVALGHSVSAMYAVSFKADPIAAAFNFYMYSWAKPSILLTLALGVLLIWALRERQLVLFAALAVFSWLIRGKIDYGLRGLGLILLFYIFISRRWLSLPCILAYMLWWGLEGNGYELFGVRFGIQTFAMLALPFIYIRSHSRLRLPRWVFYLFYPAHMALIYVLCHLA